MVKRFFPAACIVFSLSIVAATAKLPAEEAADGYDFPSLSTPVLIGYLLALKEGSHARVLSELSARNDADSQDALIALLSSPVEDVQMIAIDVAGRRGHAVYYPHLLSVILNNGGLQNHAFDAICRLRGISDVSRKFAEDSLKRNYENYERERSNK